MSIYEIILLSSFIFVISILYSSVGHGGASGYLAAMALLGISPLIMKPVGLVLNILVSGIATIRFYRAGYFSWRIFWPIALLAIPFAFLGGTITAPDDTYKVIVGLVLLFSAFRLFTVNTNNAPVLKSVNIPLAMVCGAAIGFLSGMIGLGGGIFLSPLLLFLNWSSPKVTSGIAALFVLVNSISGLFGHLSSVRMLPEYLPYLAAAAVAGAVIGSKLGAASFVNASLIRKLLAVVLIIAGVKLLFV